MRLRVCAGAAACGILALAALAACDDNDPIYGVGGSDPTDGAGEISLEMRSGDLQNGRTSEAFPMPLVVRASRAAGLVDGAQNTRDIVPVDSLEIRWAITKGVATLSSPVSITDLRGEASVTVTPGPLLGDIEVTATVAAAPRDSVEFSLRATAYLIEILINRFEVPLGGDSIEVVLGDTVEWVNRDALKHAVLSTSEPDTLFAFYSGDLANSQRFRYVPRVEGVFEYVDPLSVQAQAPTGKISVVGRNFGGLTVITSTTGDNVDPAYVVTVDGTRSSAIGPADQVTFPALSATAHAVRLVEVAPNCAVAGDNPRAVTVVASDTVTTTFAVSCN